MRSFKEQGRGSLQSMIFVIFSPINSFTLDYVSRREEEEELKMEQLSTSDTMLKKLSLFNVQKDIGPTIKRILTLFYIISIFFVAVVGNNKGMHRVYCFWIFFQPLNSSSTLAHMNRRNRGLRLGKATAFQVIGQSICCSHKDALGTFFRNFFSVAPSQTWPLFRLNFSFVGLFHHTASDPVGVSFQRVIP